LFVFSLQKDGPSKKKNVMIFSEGGVMLCPCRFCHAIHLSKSAGKSHHLFHITGQLLQANPAQKPGLELGGGVPYLHIWDLS